MKVRKERRRIVYICIAFIVVHMVFNTWRNESGVGNVAVDVEFCGVEDRVIAKGGGVTEFEE